MIYRRGNRSGLSFSWWWSLLLIGAVVAVFAVVQNLNTPVNTINMASDLIASTPTPVQHLTRLDVLPTQTPDRQAPRRHIIFPTAPYEASIVEARRAGDSWEMRYLGSSVGHLAGTSWLTDAGGNIVLAGHIEDAQGEPGPFAHLAEFKIGDLIILQEDNRLTNYRVVKVAHAAPNEMQYVNQDGRRRLTLITCSDWDSRTASYLTRLVVVANLSG